MILLEIHKYKWYLIGESGKFAERREDFLSVKLRRFSMSKRRSTLAFLLLAFSFITLMFSPVSARELTPAMETAISWIDQNKATYNDVARYIWGNPELSLVEFKSSAKLQEYLSVNGFKIEKGVAGMPTAFVATWGSGKPVIGIMAEFDALPGLSQESGVASKKPVVAGAPGHGCGHNLFGTSSATAAIAMTKAMAKFGIKGTVKLFGTPAEETLIGKPFMNRDGVFDGTDIVIDWHPEYINGTNYASSLAQDSIKFRFYGKASHAGFAPEAGRSALDAVELMNVAANFMREHVIQGAKISYAITKTEQVPSIVPAFAESWYVIRTQRRAQLDPLRDWLIDIAKGAALMTQTRMEYQVIVGVYEYLPNKKLSMMGDEVAKLIGPPPFTAEDQQFGEAVVKGMGKKLQGEAYSSKITTSDYSKTFPDIPFVGASMDVNYTWRFPSLHFVAATFANETPIHSWITVCQTGTDPSVKAGLQVSKYMAAAGIECLTNPGLVQDAWTELNQDLKRLGPYKEPIPKDAKLPTFKDLYGIEPEAVPGMKK
jgi:aminobenzoyl-glutamate utilization protein B